MPYDKPEDLADDRLRGIEKIAAFLGEPERRVAYMIERNLIPHSREGRSVITFKTWLRKHYACPERAALDIEISADSQ
jgi:hypothetical protein